MVGKQGESNRDFHNQTITYRVIAWLNAAGMITIHLVESMYNAVMLRKRSLKEKGFLVSYLQNWLTGEIAEVAFHFSRRKPQRSVFPFAFGVISRACSTMPVEVVFIPNSQNSGRKKVVRFKFSNKSSFSGELSKAACFIPDCPERSFEVVENHDPSAFVKFHFPRGLVDKIFVTGNSALLRRVFHFA